MILKNGSVNMNKEEIRSRVCKELRDELGKRYDIEDIRVISYKKNNGVFVEGVSVKLKGCNTMPCVYSEHLDAIRTETELEAVVARLAERFEGAIENALRAQLPTDIDFENSKGRIILSLINYEMNRDRLENCPHIVFNDLAVTFRLLFDIDDSNASTLIDDTIASFWGVGTEELWNIAIENSVRDLPVCIEKLEDVLMRFTGNEVLMDPDEISNPFYIVTNRRLYFGAASILYKDVPADIYENTGCNYYILPSSVNELIIVPENVCDDKQFLKGMVESVNKTLYNRTDFLSDSVYYYDHDEKSISIA